MNYDIHMEPTKTDSYSVLNSFNSCPYVVYFTDENGTEFSVDVRDDLDKCWDNYPTSLYSDHFKDIHEEKIRSFWNKDLEVNPVVQLYDETKYPDTAFTDEDFDYEMFESECENSIVYLDVEGDSDLIEDNDSIYRTIDYIRTEDSNVDTIIVRITKKGKVIKAYHFDMGESVKSADDVRDSMKDQDSNR